jgi:hypothetical protein
MMVSNYNRTWLKGFILLSCWCAVSCSVSVFTRTPMTGRNYLLAELSWIQVMTSSFCWASC